ncbi:MAG: DUF4342 domain-containing protein [Oscillospiraceae bacterium]|jgi:hypothetical protein|nr:DUF4342 domain-containing protein [Oscillospiraceae bacterium]
MKDMFEKIEYLRANANVGYEEAETLLERFDGDPLRVMIELERMNRVYGSAERGGHPWENMFTRGKEHAERCYHKHLHDPDNWVRKALRAKVRINRNGEKLCDLPVAAAGAVAVFAPYAAIAGAVGGFLMGCRIEYPRNDGGRQEDTVQ